MGFKNGFLLIALVAGCVAIPPPKTDDLSIFFEHADPAARIVGGTVAEDGKYKHSVALTTGTLIRSFGCGGSIVSTRTVLTAAHCVAAFMSWGSLVSSLRGTVGSNRWNSGGTNYGFSHRISHPDYVSSTIKNDIGLLITSSDIIETATVGVIPLAFDEIPGGVLSKVAGWGRIRNGGALSTQLLELYISTIDGQQCVEDVAQAAIEFNVRAPPVDPSIEICVHHSAGHGTCNGDSGSALVRVNDDRQVGVVSWGFPCARGAPDMFVRVSAFADWLQQNIV